LRRITTYLDDEIEVGQEIAVRGPYGNHFPVEDKLKGKDVLFIAGGIGLAPMRSVINYMLDKRARLRQHRYRVRRPKQRRLCALSGADGNLA
jgi:NAD(P)H-flavin reductase